MFTNCYLFIRFWRGMYGRFESGIHPREPLNDILLASLDHTSSLEDHVQHLTKRIINFKNLITSSAKRLHDVTKTRLVEKASEVNDNRYRHFAYIRDIFP